MQTYDVVGGQVTRVSPNGGITALTVTNADTTLSVYVSDTPTVGGYPLGPGSSMSWDPLRPLYLSCDTGNLVKVYILENAGNLFNADAVAQSIINAGLAHDIASEVALQGAPTLSAVKTVFTGFITLTNNNTGTSGYLYVGEFSSLYFNVRDLGTAGQVRSVNVAYYNDIGGGVLREVWRTSFATRDNLNSFNPGPYATCVVPCHGQFVQVTFSACALGSQVNYDIFGSYRSASDVSYAMSYPTVDPLPAGMQQAGLAADNMIGYVWQNVPAGAYRIPLPMRSGPIKATVKVDGGTGVYLTILEIWSWTLGQPLYVSDPVQYAANTNSQFQATFPARPVELYASVTSLTPVIRVAIYFDRQGN